MDQGEAVRRHLDHLRRRNLRPNTILLRQRVLGRFTRFLGRRSLLRVRHDDLVGFLDRLGESSSRYTELTQLAAFYRWAVLEGIVRSDPTGRLERPQRRRGLPRPIPDDELSRAFAGAGDRVRPMLYLAAYAGLRACEIAQLRGEALLVKQDPPIIVVEVAKGGGMRTVPIGPLLRDRVLEEGLTGFGWCFPLRDGRAGPISAHLASQLANTELHRLGIPHTLHTLRHWYGTKCQQLGHDLRATQELLGHASIVSTTVYTRNDPGFLVEIVSRLPEL